MTTPRRIGLFAWACLVTTACTDALLPDPDLERMIDQERYDPYQASPYFADGRVMRTPPRGTVPRERVLTEPAIRDGAIEGQFVARIPVPVTRDRIQRGQRDFETFCAACHGVLGDGDSQVAANMSLRKPPSLVDPTVQAMAPGRIYAAVTEGFGLMRSYAAELEIDRRWGVVAYVEALRRSRGVPLASLPAPVRQRAEDALR